MTVHKNLTWSWRQSRNSTYLLASAAAPSAHLISTCLPPPRSLSSLYSRSSPQRMRRVSGLLPPQRTRILSRPRTSSLTSRGRYVHVPLCIPTTRLTSYDSHLQNGHTPSTDVAVIIGLRSCAPSGDCDAIADSGTLGTILYKGTYDPILRTGGGSMYQNFTVAVPDTVGTGSALLSVAHFYAGGVSAAPFSGPEGRVANNVYAQVANSPVIDTAYIVVEIDSA